MKKPSLKPTVLALSVLLSIPTFCNAMPNMQALDTNNDGQISSDEAQAGMTALFAKIDSNSDGYITLAESEAWQKSAGTEHFSQLDSDNNGTLSLAEFQAGAPQDDNGNMAASLFKRLDTDSNNALSAEEFTVMGPGNGDAAQHFAEMDTNGDSKVSQAEFLSQKPPHGGQHPGGPRSSQQ